MGSKFVVKVIFTKSNNVVHQQPTYSFDKRLNFKDCSRKLNLGILF
jgi:hypothetical protein